MQHLINISLKRRFIGRCRTSAHRLQNLPPVGWIIRYARRSQQEKWLRHLASTVVTPSGLFDAKWYLKQYPDIKEAGVDPLLHYLRFGGMEGRDPNACWSSSRYLVHNPDVKAEGMNPLVHYLMFGREEGRDSTRFMTSGIHRFIVPEFNEEWYQSQYPDVESSDYVAHEHYLRVGYLDGRRISPFAKAGDPIDDTFIDIPRCEEPEVTVIIPVYRNFNDTLRCLYSIAQQKDTKTRYKIVIADDCPEEPTAPMLRRAKGITIYTNQENLGFLRNCNQAAKTATSEFILFLNNDTVVTPGWLDSLVAVARRDPKIGIVGSKLLNADGTLQEAGGVIFSDGYGHSYGRGDSPYKPQYNYVREVDCVIGAAFMVRRELFERVGGFDDEFAPAYYEEFNLAFTLADAGYKVMYQPASEIYHLGSASYGAETRTALSERNHDLFRKRWAKRLRKHALDERDISRARERPSARGMILVIDDSVPRYDMHAGALTVFQYLSMLVKDEFKVTYLPHDRNAIQPYTTTLQQMGIEVLAAEFDLTTWLKQFGYLIDWVWVARPDVAMSYIPRLREHTSARLVYYTHDLYFLRHQRRFEVDGNKWAKSESERLKPIETAIFREVDCVTTPSTEEASIIARLAPGKAIQVLPPYFFPQNDLTAKALTHDLETRNEIIFVGGFAHDPNVDAALILVNEIMPAVWASIPEARVLIVGSNPPDNVKALQSDRVEVTGYVPQIEPYYARSRMSVSALRYGAGVKGKIVSSLEAGIPVVTTPVGNEGIGLKADQEALIGETSAELAQHIIRLFNNCKLLRELSESGRRLVATRFSEEKARMAFFLALGISHPN